MYRIQHSVRLHFFFKNKAETDSDSESISSDPDCNVQYIPLLYIPSEWSPPIVNRDAKRALEQFETNVTNLQRKLPTTCRFNLSKPQRNVISELACRPDLILYLTDKGLGPSVSERTWYIRQVLTEHLLNLANYEFIPPNAIEKALSDQRHRFLDIYSKFSYSLLSEAKETYFQRALCKNNLNRTRVPQIYGIFKSTKTDHQRLAQSSAV
jgi:hypothetical protein